MLASAPRLAWLLGPAARENNRYPVTMAGGRPRIHAEVCREVRLLRGFGTVSRNDNTQNPGRREPMSSPQRSTSVRGAVIPRDRSFLDGIATHMLAFEGDSHVEWFEGNYEDYVTDRKKRMGADADTPHRIKYRRIDA